MKKEQPFTLSQTLLLVYIMCLGFFIVVLGIIAFFKLQTWLICVIIGLPLAIWGCLKLHEYIFEGGLEKDFITKKK
jgi:ABC-type proline/glycine betaine transport system permease subunit